MCIRDSQKKIASLKDAEEIKAEKYVLKNKLFDAQMTHESRMQEIKDLSLIHIYRSDLMSGSGLSDEYCVGSDPHFWNWPHPADGSKGCCDRYRDRTDRAACHVYCMARCV